MKGAVSYSGLRFDPQLPSRADFWLRLRIRTAAISLETREGGGGVPFSIFATSRHKPLSEFRNINIDFLACETTISGC
jgi:hypothetical protein